MNALKVLVLALVCTAAAAQQNTTNTTNVAGSLDSVSLRELVTQAKAAVASNPDLAALLADIGDVNALSDAELERVVKQILAVNVTDGSIAGSGSGSKTNITAGDNTTTTTRAPTLAPVTAPQNAAPAVVGLAPAVVAMLVASVALALL